MQESRPTYSPRGAGLCRVVLLGMAGLRGLLERPSRRSARGQQVALWVCRSALSCGWDAFLFLLPACCRAVLCSPGGVGDREGRCLSTQDVLPVAWKEEEWSRALGWRAAAPTLGLSPALCRLKGHKCVWGACHVLTAGLGCVTSCECGQVAGRDLHPPGVGSGPCRSLLCGWAGVLRDPRARSTAGLG